MNATLVAVLFGLFSGVGLALMLRGLLVRRSPSLEQVGSGLRGVGFAIGDPAATGNPQASNQQFGLRRMAARLSVNTDDELRQRLRLVDKSPEAFAAERLFAAVVAFATVVSLAALAFAARIPVSPVLVAIAAVGFGVAGFYYPTLPLAEQAEERRREFRFALGSYLDFVTILLAGGAGTQSALQAAAEAGDGWAFAELRTAISRSNATGLTIWICFEQLAKDLGVSELEELAASVALAGGQGGRVKESLRAKAEAMRASQATELEALAEASTEKMIIPVVIMIAGLVLFIGVGAANVVTGGTSVVTGEDTRGQQ